MFAEASADWLGVVNFLFRARVWLGFGWLEQDHDGEDITGNGIK